MSDELETTKAEQIKSVAAGAIANAWRCPNGHLLGVVTKRNSAGGGRVNRLLVFARAYDDTEQIFAGAGRCFIDSGTILCSKCGAEKEWRLGDDYLERLRVRHKR